MRITVLAENRKNGLCDNEGGLSLCVEFGKSQFLFDTGASDIYLKNAGKLGIDINSIDTVVISHGHLDHVGGLSYLPAGKRIIAHPDMFKTYFSLQYKTFRSCPVSKDELSQKHNVCLTKKSYEIFKNIYFIGEIPRIVPFEGKGNLVGAIDSEEKIPDLHKDDTGVAIRTANGLFVIAGCGHSGICNIIEQAKKVTGEDKIFGVLGGFHLNKNLMFVDNLLNLDYITKNTIGYFKETGIKYAILGHCISDDIIDNFEKELKGVTIVHRMFSGARFEVPLMDE